MNLSFEKVVELFYNFIRMSVSLFKTISYYNNCIWWLQNIKFVKLKLYCPIVNYTFFCFLSIFNFDYLISRTKVKQRRLRWLLHVLRIEQKRIPKKGLRYNPPGKRKHERPKMILRKTFGGDFKKMELTWWTAEREAKWRISWRNGNGCIILNG